MERAIFGAGCFWGVEAEFREIPGVADTAVGFSGGTTPDPTYEEVCTGTTGHAEVCEVIFDPAVVSYERLLDAFWRMHDPTSRNRQGFDFGTQYRSAIYCTTPAQLEAALSSKAAIEASKRYARPIATEVARAGPFYRAEAYHQQYHDKRGRSARGIERRLSTDR
jgi:peptide-methionine (S)-S-oxide reductase